MDARSRGLKVHLVAAVCLSLLATGFAIAAFSLSLIALLR